MKQITEKMIEKVTTAFTKDVEYILKLCMGKTLTFAGINKIMRQIERKQNEAVQKMKTILSENENPVRDLDDEVMCFRTACDDVLTVELEEKVCCDDFERLMGCFDDMCDERYFQYFSEYVNENQTAESMRREC